MIKQAMGKMGQTLTLLLWLALVAGHGTGPGFGAPRQLTGPGFGAPRDRALKQQTLVSSSSNIARTSANSSCREACLEGYGRKVMEGAHGGVQSNSRGRAMRGLGHALGQVCSGSRGGMLKEARQRDSTLALWMHSCPRTQLCYTS